MHFPTAFTITRPLLYASSTNGMKHTQRTATDVLIHTLQSTRWERSECNHRSSQSATESYNALTGVKHRHLIQSIWEVFITNHYKNFTRQRSEISIAVTTEYLVWLSSHDPRPESSPLLLPSESTIIISNLWTELNCGIGIHRT